MSIIRKPKGSIFDPLGITPLSIGTLESKPISLNSVDTTPKEQINISHYGMQEVSREEEISNKDYEVVLFGSALHYTLEMISDFSTSALPDAITATRNRYGLDLNDYQIESIKNVFYT